MCIRDRSKEPTLIMLPPSKFRHAARTELGLFCGLGGAHMGSRRMSTACTASTDSTDSTASTDLHGLGQSGPRSRHDSD
eukprot:scaffold44861_cov33-Phaeocystis_antarctica.AAC.1